MYKKAVELREQAYKLVEQGSPKCIDVFVKSFNLFMNMGDYFSSGVTALNIGRAYVTVISIRNFEKANYWYQHSLELIDPVYFLWRARILAHLGDLEFYYLQEKFDGRSIDDVSDHFHKAENYLKEALRLFPSLAVEEIANVHSTLAAINGEVGNVAKAQLHADLGIKLFEGVKNYVHIGNTQYNLAKGLANRGHLLEAREYAYAALHTYKKFCPDCVSEIKQTEEALIIIERALSKLS